MAEEEESRFELWLTDFLNSVGVDGEVFSDYINGTLSHLQDSSEGVQEEALREILESCLEEETSLSSSCSEILSKWREWIVKPSEEKVGEAKEDPLVLAGTAPDARKEDTKSKEEAPSNIDSKAGLSTEEKMKLLSLYGCESDEDDPRDLASGDIGGVYVNRNTGVAGEAQRLHREMLKASHDAKVDRDRKERELQKQRAQDRKEKEKKRTQKQERRR